MLEFLFVALTLTFLTFAALDFYVLMSKHQYAEHLMHGYLQRMSLEGRLSATDETALLADFANIAAPVESITAPRESQGAARVLRNPLDPENSIVSLRIVARPEPEPLLIGRLVRGNTPGAGYRIVVGGSMLSERITP